MGSQVKFARIWTQYRILVLDVVGRFEIVFISRVGVEMTLCRMENIKFS